MTHIPPPTPEQFALLEQLRHSASVVGKSIDFEEAWQERSDAIRAVLAYARLGVRAADVVAANESGLRILMTARDLCLLSPPAQEAERRSGGSGA